MGNQADIEEFTHNQLEVSKIKHLKRLAAALESIAVLMEKISTSRMFVQGPESYVIDTKPLFQNRTVGGPKPEIPDENPDATELGLTREEERVIEREVNKPVAPRANKRPSIYDPKPVGRK